jgi:hypothetical protein
MLRATLEDLFFSFRIFAMRINVSFDTNGGQYNCQNTKLAHLKKGGTEE